MFQDEARFGRATDPSRSWAPPGMRPIAPALIIREYTYAYGAISPEDGVHDSLILPAMDTECMNVFLDEVSKRHPDEYILMVIDGAPCHTSGELIIPDNIELLKLPPYSPKLNPQENIWDEMREKFFGNAVFSSMDAVEDRMVYALKSLEDDKKLLKSISAWQWILDALK